MARSRRKNYDEYDEGSALLSVESAKSYLMKGLLALIISYFGYHAFISERNIFSLFRFSGQISEKNLELEKLVAEREDLDNRATLLYEKTLDKDMLDEQARRQLGLMGKNEVMIFIDK